MDGVVLPAVRVVAEWLVLAAVPAAIYVAHFFLGAVLDHVMSDEPSLLACAEAIGIKPERIASAWHKLQPPPFDEGG